MSIDLLQFSFKGNYFNGGVRYRSEFDAALDNYLVKLLKHNETLFDVVKFQYANWSHRGGQSIDDYQRGDVCIA